MAKRRAAWWVECGDQDKTDQNGSDENEIVPLIWDRHLNSLTHLLPLRSA